MTVGEKIRTKRKAMGLTQTDLGNAIGVKKNAVSKWECGRVEDIPRSKLKALAAMFDVPLSYLIDDASDITHDKLTEEILDEIKTLPIEAKQLLLAMAKQLNAAGELQANN